MKLPAFQFYPADWRKDPGVQALSFHDRGVWFEILCLMHESDRRGVLLLNGMAMPEDALARLLGLDNQILATTLTTILTYGVASREQETNALYCRRMVRDENIRKIRQEAGKLGGNPVLLNQKSTTRVKQSSTPSSSSSSSITKEEKSIHVSQVAEIFDFWKITLNHPKSVLDVKRKRLIESRLKEFTADDLKTAIRGCLASDWHMGRDPNNSKIFDGLDLILRNPSKVEQFMNYANQPQNPNGSNGNGKTYESAGERNSRYIRETLEQCFGAGSNDSSASAVDSEVTICLQPTGD